MSGNIAYVEFKVSCGSRGVADMRWRIPPSRRWLSLLSRGLDLSLVHSFHSSVRSELGLQS